MLEIIDFDVAPTDIDGLFVLRPKQIREDRGVVRELFRASAFAAAGLTAGAWQQLNVTETIHGAIRGLHGEPMSKLVGIVAGDAFGAYVDTRPESATRGNVVTVELVIGVQVFVPSGVCNGFQSVSREPSQYVYCFDAEWQPDMGGAAVHPLDPALGIRWPVAIDPSDRTLLSEKDASLPSLADAVAR